MFSKEVNIRSVEGNVLNLYEPRKLTEFYEDKMLVCRKVTNIGQGEVDAHLELTGLVKPKVHLDDLNLIQSDQTLSFKHGKRTLKVVYLKDAQPMSSQFVDIGPMEGLLIDPDLNAKLKKIRPAIGKDILKEALSCVRFEAGTVLGCDSRRFYMMDVPSDCTFSVQGECLTTILKHNIIRVDIHKRVVVFQCANGWSFIVEKNDATYPNWRPIVPDPAKYKYSWTFNRKELISILKDHLQVCGEATGMDIYSNTDGSITLKSSDPEEGVFLDDVIEGVCSGDVNTDQHTSMNPKYINDFLKSATGTTVTVSICARDAPYAFNDGEGLRGAIMGMRYWDNKGRPR